jgi:hypothetical protein
MISKSPMGPLQVAVVAVLKGDSALTTLLGGQFVYDQRAPEGKAEPYVTVGDHLSTPDNSHTSFGRDATLTLHIWTRKRSNQQGEAVAAAVNALLDHQVAAINAYLVGHKVVAIRNSFDQALTDPDPELRQHVLRFRVQTSQTS